MPTKCEKQLSPGATQAFNHYAPPLKNTDSVSRLTSQTPLYTPWLHILQEANLSLSTPPFPFCKTGITVLKSILMTRRFRICQFAYSLLLVTPKSILTVLPWSFSDTYRAAENVSHPTHTFPVAVEQGDALPSCFSFHVGNKFLGGCWFLWFCFFVFLRYI